MSAFKGRAALVTGGASGIGRATALRLGAAGAAVVVADRDAEGARAVAARLDREGRRAIAVEADVTDPAHAVRMVAETVSAFGACDVLIHSAGVGIERSFLETTAEDWRRILDIDLTGTFHCCQAAARAMIARGYGRIVVLSSTAALRGGTGRAAYGAAKAGVIGLTRVMAVELAPHGVTANCLAPGAIETELVARMHSAETRRVYRAGIPMDRYGAPEEVAEAALFLAGEGARYVSGQVLGVDGGFLAAGVMHRPGMETG